MSIIQIIQKLNVFAYHPTLTVIIFAPEKANCLCSSSSTWPNSVQNFSEFARYMCLLTLVARQLPWHGYCHITGWVVHLFSTD